MDDPYAELLPVFNAVLRPLALYAYSDEHYAPTDLRQEFIGAIDHPFVCQQGHVSSKNFVRSHVNEMIAVLVTCHVHSYHASRGQPAKSCPRHPVIESGILAAHLLGGEKAVDTRPYRDTPKLKWAYSPEVYASWKELLAQFAAAVVSYDAALLAAGDQAPLHPFIAMDAMATHKPGRRLCFTHPTGKPALVPVMMRPLDRPRNKRRKP